MLDHALPAEQTQIQQPIQLISAEVLCAIEKRRRNALKQVGPCKLGCHEIDEEVLVGGLERGCVVGISSEEEDFGVMVSLSQPRNPGLGSPVFPN